MKFSKSYLEELASPNFPREWKKGAIEYKQLKKLINGVVAELESIGLNTEVLRDLLHPEELEQEEEDGEDGDHVAPASKQRASDSPRRSAAAEWIETVSEQQQKHRSQDRSASPLGKGASFASAEISPRTTVLPLQGGANTALPQTEDKSDHLSAPLGALSLNAGDQEPLDGERRRSSGIGKKDLVRIRQRRIGSAEGTADEEDGEEEAPAVQANQRPGSSGSTAEPKAEAHDWNAHAWRERKGTDLWHGTEADQHERRQSSQRLWAPQNQPARTRSQSPSRTDQHPEKWVEGKNGRRARAQYELGGTPEHPIPRIRLFIESPENSDGEDFDDDEDAPRDGLPIIQELPPSPDVKANPPTKEQQEKADKLQALGKPAKQQEEPKEDNDNSGQRPIESAQRTRKVRKKEILIPLSADTEFLDTLTGALANLSQVQNTQRDAFIADTENLTSSIARASSPYANKSDLYVWREIFALWMEMQIFESERERDRGELSVDESEARLKRFAEELAKHGWVSSAAEVGQQPSTDASSRKRLLKRKADASATPMKDPNSARALEDFIKLNVALLDVKKFQRINVEAARKILKKHDKRTALSASDDFRSFIAKQEGARAAFASMAADNLVSLSPSAALHAGEAGSPSASQTSAMTAAHPSLAALLPSSTTGILSESLPHILLSLLSTTLLPILPSIDNFECGICYSVAWRPIRLGCSHLFCIRCLVKLQRQGKRDCPLCRAKDMVAVAGAENLDGATSNMLTTWFPREVEEKDKENEAERRKEELKELGISETNCVLM